MIYLSQGGFEPVNSKPLRSPCIVFYHMLHPIPGTCKWLKHVLKLLVYIFVLCRVALVYQKSEGRNLKISKIIEKTQF